MKNALLTLLAICLLFSTLKAQIPESPVSHRIVDAILKGQADMFRPFLDRSAKYQRDAILILNSPLQIVFQLKDFFEDHPCNSIRVIGSGSFKDFGYAKIDYRASNSQGFMFYLFFEGTKISKIRIDRK